MASCGRGWAEPVMGAALGGELVLVMCSSREAWRIIESCPDIQDSLTMSQNSIPMSSAPGVGYGRRHAGITLRLTYEAFIAAVFERLSDLGFDDLRPAHAQVFQHIKEEGVRLTELARAAGVTPQSMGALVDDLERLRYLERTPDPNDRRAALIKPTDRGTAEVAAAREVIAELESACSQKLGRQRFSALLEDLDGLLELLRNGGRSSAG
jgi:DNA-binding MarR family transcriptional regulator